MMTLESLYGPSRQGELVQDWKEGKRAILVPEEGDELEILTSQEWGRGLQIPKASSDLKVLGGEKKKIDQPRKRRRCPTGESFAKSVPRPF